MKPAAAQRYHVLPSGDDEARESLRVSQMKGSTSVRWLGEVSATAIGSS